MVRNYLAMEISSESLLTKLPARTICFSSHQPKITDRKKCQLKNRENLIDEVDFSTKSQNKLPEDHAKQSEITTQNKIKQIQTL